MMFSSDFWLNLFYFIIQVVLNLAAIWIGIYLYLRQERQEQDKKYNRILAELQKLASDVSTLKQTIAVVDRSTSHTQLHLLDTQRQILLQFVGIQNQVSELLPNPTDPELRQKLNALGQKHSNS